MDEHVFLSYARADQRYAADLAEHLNDRGLKVWYDHEIPAGSRWDQLLEKRIVECAAMLVVVTEKTESSNWVARELTLAERTGKVIVPLLRSGQMWWRLDSTQYIDVRDGHLPDEAAVRNAIEANRSDRDGRPQTRAPSTMPHRSRKRRGWWIAGLATCVVAATATAVVLLNPDDPEASPDIPFELGELQAHGDTCVEARSFERRAEGAIVLLPCTHAANQYVNAIKSGDSVSYKLKFKDEDRCLVALTSELVGTEICAAAATWRFSNIDRGDSKTSSWEIRYTGVKEQQCLTLPTVGPAPRVLTMTECGKIANTQRWWIDHPAR
ncbi:toll/interleukin-1 receptor domain-containing protein [Actinoplanes sp. Pm04-4]|uniref:Toll/interleukin-1 receptor domain-containing protein n=1 Tax=Paractinoplanes pyxinae TaxID=2997416 RepID=A0ABT4BIX4_9ACTN|nr:toll/interleukin-1 receptor domain-containing protein [Actinoplanes pyxinae]MCY1145545.1 toll/interleukin-1 receptor domain-containing protein [Actinoplanes pyxinae]